MTSSITIIKDAQFKLTAMLLNILDMPQFNAGVYEVLDVWFVQTPLQRVMPSYTLVPAMNDTILWTERRCLWVFVWVILCCKM